MGLENASPRSNTRILGVYVKFPGGSHGMGFPSFSVEICSHALPREDSVQ